MKPKRTKLDDYHNATRDASPRMRTLTPPGSRTPAGPVDPEEQSRVRTFLALAAVTAAGFVTVAYGLPTFGHGFQWWGFAAGAVGVVAAYILASDGVVVDRTVRLLSIVALVVVVLFAAGARDQVVIDGRVYSSSSREAQGHELVKDMFADLTVMSAFDELLTLDSPDARSRFSDFEPAAAELTALSTKWSRTDLGALPDPDFIEIVNLMKTSATFGAEAVNIRFRLLTEPDQRAQAALIENRSAFASSVLEAGARLVPLADRYRVDLRPVTE